MKSISAVELTIVTGGKLDAKGPAGPASSATSSALNTDSVLSKVQGLQTAIDGIGKDQNKGLFGSPMGAMCFGLIAASCMRGGGGGSQTNVSYSYGGYGGGGARIRVGYHW